ATVFPDMLHEMGVAAGHADEGNATRFAADSVWKAIGVVAPMLVGMLIVGFIANVAQVGFRPTAKKLAPDFSRLNPLKGLKKMVSAQSWWELFKSLAKTAILAVVAFPALSHVMHTLTGGTDGSMLGMAASPAGAA